jgi:hypothetical protein
MVFGSWLSSIRLVNVKFGHFGAPNSKNYVQQAIKVSSDQHNDIVWTVESKSLTHDGNRYLFHHALTVKTAPTDITYKLCVT